jgi:hypothetical protein
MRSARAKPVAVPAADQPRYGSFDAKGVKIHFLAEGNGEPVSLDPFGEGEAPPEPLRIPCRLGRSLSLPS